MRQGSFLSCPSFLERNPRRQNTTCMFPILTLWSCLTLDLRVGTFNRQSDRQKMSTSFILRRTQTPRITRNGSIFQLWAERRVSRSRSLLSTCSRSTHCIIRACRSVYFLRRNITRKSRDGIVEDRICATLKIRIIQLISRLRSWIW